MFLKDLAFTDSDKTLDSGDKILVDTLWHGTVEHEAYEGEYNPEFILK